jgi:transcriptional regulator with XRE-family HTH domain
MGSPRKTRIARTTAGEQLEGFRHERNLTLKDLGDLTGVPLQTLSAAETGRKPFSDTLAQKVAEALQLDGHQRVAFIEAADETRRINVIEVDGLFGRRIVARLKRKIKTLTEEQLKILDDAVPILSVLNVGLYAPFVYGDVEYSDRRLRQSIDRLVSPKTAAEIETIALDVRAKCQKDINKNIEIISFIERDIPQLTEYFDYEIVSEIIGQNGICSADARVIPIGKRNPKLIRLLRLTSDTYRRACSGDTGAAWIIAHELGHLFLNHMCRARSSHGRLSAATRPFETAEWQATEFAASLLMPSAGCIGLAPYQIRDRFGVSLQMATKRYERLTQRSKRAA